MDTGSDGGEEGGSGSRAATQQEQSEGHDAATTRRTRGASEGGEQATFTDVNPSASESMSSGVQRPPTPKRARREDGLEERGASEGGEQVTFTDVNPSASESMSSGVLRPPAPKRARCGYSQNRRKHASRTEDKYGHREDVDRAPGARING